MVFQQGALYPHMTVWENIAFPLQVAGETDLSLINAKVREMAFGLGIGEKLARKPSQLSGGERQRVAMGRALVRGEPTVLLMDEPLASLDIGLRNGLRAEIAAWSGRCTSPRSTSRTTRPRRWRWLTGSRC